MALRELNFTFTPEDPRPFPVGWSHRGVVGSGDMEVMFEQRDLGGDVQIKVCTPVVGFDEVWERVLDRFVRENEDGTVSITDCCAVAGLGGKTMRSGDFDYYISEPIIENDCKGVGPFVWASLEYERAKGRF